MVRFANIGAAAAIFVCVAGPVPTCAEPSLVSAWQHCETGKGCSKFAFLPNGRVIEQFDLAGNRVTAYGRYEFKGAVLEIGWQQFAPTQICGPNLAEVEAAGGHCSPTRSSGRNRTGRPSDCCAFNSRQGPEHVPPKRSPVRRRKCRQTKMESPDLIQSDRVVGKGAARGFKPGGRRRRHAAPHP